MNLTEKEILHRLGVGESIDSVCTASGCSRSEFDLWWQACATRRNPMLDGTLTAEVSSAVEIHRDAQGIPHIFADSDRDLFVAFGFAMAQDRLFQLDYLRRKAAGRLAEILGQSGVGSDLVARTVGLPHIAEAEWHRLETETQQLLSAFTSGINSVIESAKDLPIEFDLLDYRPEPWREVDCLLIENEFRWYLTGRFPVIVMPELAKRALDDATLYREFFTGEATDEFILPPEELPVKARESGESLGPEMGGPDDGVGSNNWVVSGQLSQSGKPMVASDPHIAFEAVSCWYQAHLCGGSFNTAGMTYVGMPAIMFGRNTRVAWGITNNICSQRDLYQERTDPQHPNCFLFDGRWEPCRERTETIQVRDSKPITKTIRFSRNGPIVDEILPAPANETGPVSLKWLGAYQGGWLTALLHMDRAEDVHQFSQALRPWHVPTFALVFADVDGQIGFKASGRVPLRKIPERGYRPGWDPEHQWAGLLPFEDMPAVIDPQRGWMGTANNRPAGDYPHPLSTTSPSGCRARRIRHMIEARVDSKCALEDFRQMHQDVLSLRAVNCLPHLIDALNATDTADGVARAAFDELRKWDGQVDPDSVAASIFNVFFTHWSKATAAARFDERTSTLLAGGVQGLAAKLLDDDSHGWFSGADREQQIRQTFQNALDDLRQRLGDEVSSWKWGRLHLLKLNHVLGSRGDLGTLLNYGGQGVRGDMQAVCNTGSGPEWSAATGGGFRMVADLGDNKKGLWTIDGQSQSGQPGSPHYQDQLPSWLAGEYNYLAMDHDAIAETVKYRMTLQPKT